MAYRIVDTTPASIDGLTFSGAERYHHDQVVVEGYGVVQELTREQFDSMDPADIDQLLKDAAARRGAGR